MTQKSDSNGTAGVQPDVNEVKAATLTAHPVANTEATAPDIDDSSGEDNSTLASKLIAATQYGTVVVHNNEHLYIKLELPVQ